jgi:RNA polymerase sigma-70 factor (ECF subfamily)
MLSNTPDPDSCPISAGATRNLDQLLSMLPAEHREVLVLREIEELNYRQIAALTDVSIGTVMARLARARASVKAMLRNRSNLRRAGTR